MVKLWAVKEKTRKIKKKKTPIKIKESKTRKSAREESKLAEIISVGLYNVNPSRALPVWKKVYIVHALFTSLALV